MSDDYPDQEANRIANVQKIQVNQKNGDGVTLKDRGAAADAQSSASVSHIASILAASLGDE